MVLRESPGFEIQLELMYMLNYVLDVDEIIRTHKMACLRITSLATCGDALWAGTSSGVILTIPLPKLASFLSKTDTCPAAVVTGKPLFLKSTHNFNRAHT